MWVQVHRLFGYMEEEVVLVEVDIQVLGSTVVQGLQPALVDCHCCMWEFCIALGIGSQKLDSSEWQKKVQLPLEPHLPSYKIQVDRIHPSMVVEVKVGWVWSVLCQGLKAVLCQGLELVLLVYYEYQCSCIGNNTGFLGQ